MDAESKTKKLLQSLDCKSVNQWGSHCPRLSPDSRFTTKEVLENVWAEAPIPFYVDKNLAANQDTSPEAKKKFVNSLVKPKPSEVSYFSNHTYTYIPFQAKRTDSLIAMRKSLVSRLSASPTHSVLVCRIPFVANDENETIFSLLSLLQFYLTKNWLKQISQLRIVSNQRNIGMFTNENLAILNYIWVCMIQPNRCLLVKRGKHSHIWNSMNSD